MLVKSIIHFMEELQMEWKNTLFGTALTQYISMERNKLQDTTYESYINYANRIKKYFDTRNIKVCDIDICIIEDYYYFLRQRGICENTVKHYHIIISKFLKYLYKRRYITTDFTLFIERPKAKKYQSNFLTDDECNLLIEKAKNTNLYTAIILSLYYGLRRSEVCGLQWHNIDFNRNVICINQKLADTKVDGKKHLLLCKELKSDSSCRTLPLFPEIKEYLLSIKGDDEDFVFTINNGRPVAPDYLTDKFRRFISKYKLPKIRFHDLRHSCASILVNNNIEMKYIQNYLGHSTFNITADLYSHLYVHSNKICIESIANTLYKNI